MIGSLRLVAFWFLSLSPFICSGTLATPRPRAADLPTLPANGPGPVTAATCSINSLTVAGVGATQVYLTVANEAHSSTLQLRQQGTTDWIDDQSVGEYTHETVRVGGLLPSTAYEARLIGLCHDSLTAASGVSAFTTASPVSCAAATKLTALAISPTAALVAWKANEPWAKEAVEYRLVNAVAWNRAGYDQQQTSILDRLTAGDVYEWRVASTCPASYTTGLNVVYEYTTVYSEVRSFTAQCTTPLSLITSGVQSTVALLCWKRAGYDDKSTFRVRWRPRNAETWLYTEPLGGFDFNDGSYTLTALTNDTPYEWQVQSLCEEDGATTFSESATFTTACGPPAVAAITNVKARSVGVYLTDAPIGSQFDVEYWPLSAPAAVATAQSPRKEHPDGFFGFTIPGLRPTTAYGWRIRTRCGADVVSAYGKPGQFTTDGRQTDLSLRMLVSSRTPKVGDVVTFSLIVQNAAGADSSGYYVLNTLPDGLTFADSPAPTLHAAQHTILLYDSGLAGGESKVYAYRASVLRPGTFINAAELTESDRSDGDSQPRTGWADGEDDATQVDLRTADGNGPVWASSNPNQRVLPPVQASQPTPDPSTADLSLDLSSSARTLLTPQPLTLTARISNRGGASASGILVKLRLPAAWSMLDPNWRSTGTVNEYVNEQAVAVEAENSQLLTIQVWAAGLGSQAVRAQIAASHVPDPDSTPNNSYTNGEDDTALVEVRM